MAERVAEARGRPLRALAVVLGGWIALRVAWLWPGAVEPVDLRPVVPRPPLRTPAARVLPVAALPVTPIARRPPSPQAAVATAPVVGVPTFAAIPTAPRRVPDASSAAAPSRPAVEHVLALLGLVRFGTPDPAPPGPSRWSGSGWAIVRGAGAGTTTGGVATPQLGGSQAGLRLAYALSSRWAVAGRVATALATRQQEAAIGVEWRPGTLPVRVVAERRIGIARTRGGAALGVAGGVDDRALPLGLSLDAYVQAGVIARDGGEGYADGALRVGRPVGPLDLSMGAWGAAQRGAARVDIGPSIGVAVPVANMRWRVALDWRERVAGDARPASGVALSLGADF